LTILNKWPARLNIGPKLAVSGSCLRFAAPGKYFLEASRLGAAWIERE
jgi:hypothetical protein